MRTQTLTTITSALLASALGAQQTPAFGACEVTTNPRYENAALRSVYIPMSDGVRLAVDVIVPSDLPASDKLPTVLILTRYWRAQEGQPPTASQRYWVRHGYAVVSGDVRGTGASFGVWPHPWSDQQIRDAGEIVDWIVKQPWSDGAVTSIGTSYTANTAELVAMSNRPAVKAVVPRFADFDVFADLIMPGGLFNDFMGREWGGFVRQLDANTKQGQPPRGVRPVDEDRDGSLLAAAVRDHAKNPDVYEASKSITYRDDRARGWNASIDTFSTHRRRHLMERAKVPIYGWAGWLDAGTADGVLKRYNTFANPQRVVIGPWSHGAGFHASPFLPADAPTDPPPATQSREALCFFEHHARGRPNAVAARGITYYTLGEEKWKTTAVWPPTGSAPQRWYLSAGNALSRTAPAAAAGSDSYTVDFEATTGKQNRWYTQLGGGDVIYPDRAEADKRLLTYTSPPLGADVEVTGHPVVHLHFASTATDGSMFVYLEDVNESGRVTYVTEGEIRAIHRRLSTERPPHAVLAPYHSFLRKDGEPLVPGQMTELRFGLLPTSVLFKRGHRIRIAIAGADKDTFDRVPANGTPALTVSRNARAASFVELPVIAAQKR